MTDVLTASHLGAMPYAEGVALQEALLSRRASGHAELTGVGDLLLFPDHPPVLTMGRGGRQDSLKVDRATLARLGLELFDASRGGDVTWHGPGQLVGYPIVDLARRGRDLHRFLRDLEEALIRALERWGIAAQRVPGRTGVWVDGQKIASIGIAVRSWFSYHGFALNVAPDLRFFELIHPCGLRGIHMTSVAARLGSRAPTLDEARRDVAATFGRQLGYREVRWVAAGEVRRLAGRAAVCPAEKAVPFQAA